MLFLPQGQGALAPAAFLLLMVLACKRQRLLSCSRHGAPPCVCMFLLMHAFALHVAWGLERCGYRCQRIGRMPTRHWSLAHPNQSITHRLSIANLRCSEPEEGIERDVFNEKPAAEDLMAAGDVPLSGVLLPRGGLAVTLFICITCVVGAYVSAEPG